MKNPRSVSFSDYRPELACPCGWTLGWTLDIVPFTRHGVIFDLVREHIATHNQPVAERIEALQIENAIVGLDCVNCGKRLAEKTWAACTPEEDRRLRNMLQHVLECSNE